MATQTFELTKDWQLIANINTNFLLNAAGENANRPFYIAVNDSNEAPNVELGHPVYPEEHEAVTRADIGPGYVYAKVLGGTNFTLSVTAWTE